ncbi:MAG: hypothetical protein ACREQY_07640, partial [Candidatus Binatia bacterium]
GMEGAVTMRNNRIRSAVLAGALGLLQSGGAEAYFEIELASGGTVLANSYTESGAKLHLYRPSGVLHVDRAAVKEIREREGTVPESAMPKPAAVAAVAPIAPKAQPKGEIVEYAPSVVVPEGEDPAKVEQALTMKLILANRDLLFARNGGEDEKALEKRKKEIEQIQKQRESVQKRLHR